MSNLAESLGPILLGIISSVVTTVLTSYIREQRRRGIEQITKKDDRMGILTSIAINSSFSFLVASAIARSDFGSLKVKWEFYLGLGLSVIFWTYVHLRFHRSFLLATYRSKTTRKSLIGLAVLILLCWVFALAGVTGLIINDKGGFFWQTPLMLFYFVLFTLSQYFKWDTTRVYSKITVRTLEGAEYVTLSLAFHDDSVTLYDEKDDKMILLPLHQVVSVVYAYEKTTIKSFIDGEH